MKLSKVIRPHLIILILFFFIGNAFAGEITFTLKAGDYQISTDKEGFDMIKMEGFTSMASPGDPVLPIKIYNIAIPPDIYFESLQLSIIDATSEKSLGNYSIKPCSPDVTWTGEKEFFYWGEGKNIVDGKNMNVYGVDAFFPPEMLKLLPESQLRKWKFIKVAFSPFQYNPITGELKLTKKVVAKITYLQTGEIPSEELLRDTVMDDIAQKIFLNYDEAKEWYTSTEPGELEGIIYNYVIITTNAIKTNSTKLNAFITHKTNKGFSVAVITESDFGILTGQSPNHKAEKIREWLKNNYISMGIGYVLLIGNPFPYESGEGDIPMKMCWPRHNAGSDEESPTDYFYADLTGNWDKDADGFYGEWSDDFPVSGGVDFTPEVYVGRIPVYSADYTTLDNILQKIIDYESESGNISWRKNTLLPMSFSTTTYDGAPLAEQMKDDYLTSAGYSYWRQYQQGSGACALNSIYSSEEELRGDTVVKNRWQNNDYGVVCWWGHGSSLTAWVGCDGCWDGWLFYASQCSSLDDDHPSFTYQCSCTNGYPENNNNLGYSLLRQGSIGTVSATRVSWFNTGVGYGDFDGSTTNSGLGYEYVKRLAVNEYPAGKALYLTKSSMSPEMNTRLMNWYDFNLYGDPSTSLADQKTMETAEYIVRGDMDGNGLDEVIGDFGDDGIWVYYNDSTWTKLHGKDPFFMACADMDGNGLDELIIDFGSAGIWIYYNNSTWTKLHGKDPFFMACADMDGNGLDEVIIDFGTAGIWIYYNNSTWTKLHSKTSALIACGDMDNNGQDEVIIDFGSAGIWIYYNDSTWTKLHSKTSAFMACADMDGNGLDEVIIDFGTAGIWIYYNNSTWTKLHSKTSAFIACGDMDNNGQAEVIIDFGSVAGIWTYSNNSSWSKLHNRSSLCMVCADMDGNGQEDVVIEFGAIYGIWGYYNNSTWSKIN
jgi:hypothetical protein